MARKPGRPRTGQEPLDRRRIVVAALRLVDAQGIEALSMRRLAVALGVDPMALYHHFSGKGAIIIAMVEQVFGEMRVPHAASASWQDRVRAFARAYRRVVAAHPNLVAHLVANAQAAAAATVEVSETLYAALAAAELPPRSIVRAADLVVDYVNGFALAEAAAPLEQRGARSPLLEELRARPDEQLPVMRCVLLGLPEHDLAGDFEFGLDVVIRGLEAIAPTAGRSTVPVGG